MRKRTGALAVQILVLAFIYAEASSVRAQTIDQAMWVWPSQTDGTPVSDPTQRQALVQNAQASGVTDLYVSVYQTSASPQGRQMFADPVLADLIQRAHASKMKVWAEYGDSSWIGYSCTDSAFPVARMAEVTAYNAANPSASLDGVILDVEPSDSVTPTPTPTPYRVKSSGSSPSWPELVSLLALYNCIIGKVPQLPVSAAISAYWNPPAVPEYDPFFQRVIRLHLAHVVVMGYLNLVGSSDCSQPGIACLDSPAISYWQTCPSMHIAGCQSGRSGNILAGIETQNISSTGDTFFTMGETAMNQAAAAMLCQFPNGGLGGFAIDYYQNAYLSGTSSPQWPTVNASFPQTCGSPKQSKVSP
jgi:hypothetical protein